MLLGSRVIDEVVVLEDDVPPIEMRYFWIIGDIDQDGDGFVVDQIFLNLDASEDIHVIKGGYHH